MITDLVEAPPIACTLGAGDFKARLAWIAALNAASLRAERQDGLRLELTYAPEARDQVLELIRREQACCAFLSFALDEDPSGLRLTVEAPEAVRDGVDAVFEPFRSKVTAMSGCGCCAGAAA